jgi:predicted kinase
MTNWLDVKAAEKQVIIMRGLPGSGKSTKARSHGGVIVSADDFFMQGDEYVYDRSKIGEAHDESKRKFLEAIKAGEPLVVVDNTNTQPWEYADYERWAGEHGYEVTIDEVKTDLTPEELAQRTVHGVPAEIIQKMKDRMEARASSWLDVKGEAAAPEDWGERLKKMVQESHAELEGLSPEDQQKRLEEVVGQMAEDLNIIPESPPYSQDFAQTIIERMKQQGAPSSYIVSQNSANPGWLDVKGEEYQKDNLSQWAQDTFMTGPGVYKFDWAKIREEGGRLGLAEFEIDDVVSDLERISASACGLLDPIKGSISMDADSVARTLLRWDYKGEPPEDPEDIKKISEWASDPDRMTELILWFSGPQNTAGVKTNISRGELSKMVESMSMLTPAQAADESDPFTKLRMLVTDVPEAVKKDIVLAHDYGAKIRDAILALMESDQTAIDKDTLSKMLGSIVNNAQKGQEMNDPGTVMIGIEEVKSLLPGFKSVATSQEGVTAMETGIGWLDTQAALEREMEPFQEHVKKHMEANPDMSREAAEEFVRKTEKKVFSSDQRLELWWDMARQAMTGYTDAKGTARAAYLLGQCTKEMWKKSIGDIKKECGKEIKDRVNRLTKWGTIPAGPPAVRDVIQKVLQEKGIEPYTEIVVGIMDAMGNPLVGSPGPSQSPKGGLQDRGLGAETAWPISEPR